VIGCWRRWRRRNPGAPVWRLLLWESIRHIAFLAMFLAYRVRSFGHRNVPADGPVLLLCNHQSYLDLLALGSALPHRHFFAMARKTLFRSRHFGGLIRGLNAFEVDQERGDIRAIRTAIELLKAGQMVLIFPEGSRTPDGTVQGFQEGVMLLIRRARPTIVPAALEGPYDAWPIGRKRPRLNARVAVEFGNPIPAEELLKLDSRQVLDQLAQQIETMRLQLRERLKTQSDGRFPRSAERLTP